MSIVEKMARAISGAPFPSAKSTAKARAAITATGLTEAQLEGLENGTMVVVPVEPTRPMLDAWFRTLILRRPLDECYRAMLAAKEG